MARQRRHLAHIAVVWLCRDGCSHRSARLEIDHIRDIPDRQPRRRFCQVVASQKFVSEGPIAILRQSAHATDVSDECTEAHLETRIRYSDNVSGPLPTSTVVLSNCVPRPVHQVGISIPKGRNGPAPSGIARRARPAGQRYCAAAGLRGTSRRYDVEPIFAPVGCETRGLLRERRPILHRIRVSQCRIIGLRAFPSWTNEAASPLTIPAAFRSCRPGTSS